MTDGTTTWTYTYDANGLRTSRSNGTTTYNYIYNGTSLVQMTVGNDTLYFAYDSSSPMTVTYNGVVFYYVTNLQGDVIAILDATGTAVVEYTYDAWGNILTTSGTMADTLGTVNPLRYRGYVYDRETDLYYLQSRYYNSEIGRFINADGLVSTGQGLLSNNMFAYCLNNPVCLIDPDGDCPHDGKFYTSGLFEGQFEYNPSCTLCASHGEFILIGPSGVLIDMTTFDLTEDQKVLIATIAAEATVTAQGEYVSPQARQAMANVALNRVGKREWAKYKTVADICAYTGFDGYGSRDYYNCMYYLNNRDGSNASYEAIIWDTMKAYEWDITNGCQLYYTPATMYPQGRVPSWNFDLLEEVAIPGVDSYYEGRFFRYR